MYSAKQLISSNVVTGFPDQRLAYLAEKISSKRAQYCAVLAPRTFAVLGLVRFSDVAANPSTATRIFSDLMHPPPLFQILDTDPAEKLLDHLAHDPAEVLVVRPSGEFVGLITPDSFVRWLLSVGASHRLDLRRIPSNSRWNPFSGSGSPFRESGGK